MNVPTVDFEVTPLPVPPSVLGESPTWWPAHAHQRGALWWCDIPGRALHRFEPESGQHTAWPMPTEPSCLAPMHSGQVLLAMRDGLWVFDPRTGQRTALAPPPYDPAHERFNDGKADAQGRLWVGTIYEPRQPALAALYCWDGHRLTRRAEGITVSNGLAFSPDGATLYWSDTKAHTIYAMDFRAADGHLGPRRTWHEFAPRLPQQDLQAYGGRPDGATVDSQGCYWVAMFEGAQLLRLSPEGQVLQRVPLPVRCPTMPCLGGDDLRTLYVTTSRQGRPSDELQREPWAGQVLQMRVPVPGLPPHFARG